MVHVGLYIVSTGNWVGEMRTKIAEGSSGGTYYKEDQYLVKFILLIIMLPVSKWLDLEIKS